MSSSRRMQLAREVAAFRKTLGAPARGDAATDGVFNHETGAGVISGVDWEPAGRRLRPDRGARQWMWSFMRRGPARFQPSGGEFAPARGARNQGTRWARRHGLINVQRAWLVRGALVHWARRISTAITVAFGEHLAEQAKGVAREAGRAAQGAPVRPMLADWVPQAVTAPPMPQLTLPAPQEPLPDTPPPRPCQVTPSRPPMGGTILMEVD